MPSKTNPALPAGTDGPVAIGHSPEVAAEYRKAASEHQRRQASGLPPASAQAPQAAQAAPAGRVDAGLAGRLRDRQVQALKADIMRWGKEVQAPIGMTGVVIPHMVDRQRQLQSGIEGAQREIERLAALDGQELIDWALASGLIRFTQSGNAVL